MGWAFHFLIGGGGVALLYAVWLQLAGWTLPVQYLWGGVALVYMACGVLGLIGTVLTRETWGKRQRDEVDAIIARS